MKTASRAGAALGAAVLAAPGPAQAQPGAASIGSGRGNSSAAVRCVQQGINSIVSDRFATQHDLIGVDGSFGPETDEAVRYVQYRLLGASEADGVVGPRTGDLIMRYQYGNYAACYPYVPTSN
ncbi:peptidoglycan-binding domain-containing protein [Streptomyces sp. NPDC091278]|uniref:peptidoglycan-binding domain-containing protein n=1 Tax=Streptomyces sp. NPDC091278 TaxID=3155301 RepID=UPI00344F826A